MEHHERRTAIEGWDWRAELTRQERSIPWLARKTGRADMTVYRYARGQLTAPRAWLVAAAEILGIEVSA